MREYGISLTRILPYKNKTYDSVYKRKNSGQWKPVFSQILCSNTDIYFFLAVIVHRCFPLDSASFFLIYSSRNNVLRNSVFLIRIAVIDALGFVLVPEQGYLVSGEYENIVNSKKHHKKVENFREKRLLELITDCFCKLSS